jgi:hypothetical protein
MQVVQADDDLGFGVGGRLTCLGDEDSGEFIDSRRQDAPPLIQTCPSPGMA